MVKGERNSRKNVLSLFIRGPPRFMDGESACFTKKIAPILNMPLSAARSTRSSVSEYPGNERNTTLRPRGEHGGAAKDLNLVCTQ